MAGKLHYTSATTIIRTVSLPPTLFTNNAFRGPPASGAAASPVIWIVNDGKHGHFNQSMGLAEALLRAAPGSVHLIPALAKSHAGWVWLTKNSPFHALPPPDLILGAGHATHLTLLAARRAHGGRAVVIMRPSLPRSWFDLCIVPEHDGIAPDAYTLVTQGALNRIRASNQHDTGRGLILIGGVSPHFEWNSDAIAVQIQSVLANTPDVQWTLADSRRTPSDFLDKLSPHPRLQCVSHTTTSSDWLPGQLARAAIVWVTPDSASMVYEALTAGANVGVFDLPVNPRSRVGHAIAQLADTQRVTRFISWCAHGRLHCNLHPLAETDRCAHWILAWLKQN